MSNKKSISTSSNSNKRKKHSLVSETSSKNLKFEKCIKNDEDKKFEKMITEESLSLNDENKENKPNDKMDNENDKTIHDNESDKTVLDSENDKTIHDNEGDEKVNKSEDLSYSEFYLDTGYAHKNENKEQYYAKDSNNNDTYFKDENGKEIYAYKTVKIGDSEQRIQYPATENNGEVKYIYNEGYPKYPENLDTAEIIFPKNPITKEDYYLPTESGELRYPMNSLFRQFYRKDANGNEVPIGNDYAKDENFHQIYPKLSNGDEFYIKDEINGLEKGAFKVENGKQVHYYARKANGDEVYPRKWLNNK